MPISFKLLDVLKQPLNPINRTINKVSSWWDNLTNRGGRDYTTSLPSFYDPQEARRKSQAIQQQVQQTTARRTLPTSDFDTIASAGTDRTGYTPGTADYINSVDDYIKRIEESVDAFYKPYEEEAKKSKEFDEKNPFNFDEVMARASAEERFDPFYKAELRDFLTGVIRERGRGHEDEERLRQELTTTTENFVGRSRRQLNEALEASREGFAGAGLFFGGQRIRREGTTAMEGEEKIGDFLRHQGIRMRESKLREERLGEDLALREGTYRRGHKAARETDILTDIGKQKTEYQQQRELEKQQYIGYPLASGKSSLSSIFGLT